MIDTVETALWRALAGLMPGYTVTGATDTAASVDAPSLPTNTRPLRHIRRFAGDFGAPLVEDVSKGLEGLRLQQYPAAFLAFLKSTPVGADGVYARPILDERMVVRRSYWRVFVATGDLRGDAHAMKADVAGQPAALLATSVVEETLGGLRIAGLLDDAPVAWVASTVYLVSKRGFYVMAVDFSTDTAFAATAAPTGEPLEVGVGTLGPDGAPFNQASITFEP